MIMYLALKNADLTEGRGPMVPHSLWDNLDAAKRFILSNEPYGNKMLTERDGNWFGQFWELKLMVVRSSFDPAYVKSLRDRKGTLERELETLNAELKNY